MRLVVLYCLCSVSFAVYTLQAIMIRSTGKAKKKRAALLLFIFSQIIDRILKVFYLHTLRTM